MYIQRVLLKEVHQSHTMSLTILMDGSGPLVGGVPKNERLSRLLFNYSRSDSARVLVSE